SSDFKREPLFYQTLSLNSTPSGILNRQIINGVGISIDYGEKKNTSSLFTKGIEVIMQMHND
ncbi:MAG: hypothetical protein V7735_10200, partial [Photobacterium frigidiphilum]|uniref:hypothetical protein n=1 Tax=Photobacterium frigidiphilum TaxID=264736 RepID=UPI0030016078